MTRKALVVMLMLGWLSSPLMADEARPVSGLIVKLKKQKAQVAGTSATPERRLSRVAFSAGYTTLMPWRKMGSDMAVMKVPTRLKQATAERLMAQAMATGEIEWVEPNVREKLLAAVVPNDPGYDRNPMEHGQWWLQSSTTGSTADRADRQRGAANINQAWQTTTGVPSSAVIAVLDTGVLTGPNVHPDIDATRRLPGYDFISDVEAAHDGQSGWDADPTDTGDWITDAENASGEFKGCGVRDSSWHGTVIEGILAARSNNGVGGAGINWNGRILPVRVAGKCGAEVTDIINGMRWAAGLQVGSVPLNPPANKARIINISFGGYGPCTPAYQAAINEVRAQGVIVVAAAGNEHGAVSRPANCVGVISVASLNREGFKSSYSNFGPEVFISTTGGDPAGADSPGRWSPYLADTGLYGVYNMGETTAGASAYAYVAGTSFASPVVAGVLSLMLDVRPTLTLSQLEDGLRRSARPHVTSALMAACTNENPGRCACSTSTCGHGILDAAEAVRYATDPDAYSSPTWTIEDIDSDEVRAALAFAPKDRDANPVVATSGVASAGGGGGGGGGALDPLSLFGMAAALLAVGRQRKSTARPVQR